MVESVMSQCINPECELIIIGPEKHDCPECGAEMG